MTACAPMSHNHVVVVPTHANDHEMDQQKQKTTQVTEELDNNITNIDYSQRAQWLRAAVLGANDGLVSVASLMMGVGAVKKDAKAMLLAGFAGSVAGACAMAIGEFVSVYTQYDVEVGQIKRDMKKINSGIDDDDDEKELEMRLEKRRSLPSPLQAALASAFSFSIGAIVPLLSAAFVTDYKMRLLVVVAVASLALFVIGSVGAELGKTPKLWSCVRVLVGGWMAMALTFGLTKSLGYSGLEL